MGIGGYLGLINNFGSSNSDVVSNGLNALGFNQVNSLLGFNFSRQLSRKIFNEDDNKDKLTLKDVQLQTSTYSRVISEVFGTVRVAGNIIWSSPIKKEIIYQRQSFGKNTSSNSYTLITSSFVVAISNGNIEKILGIYADNELLDQTKFRIEIYLGGEVNTTNSTLKSYLGEDAFPMKDLCYVVFTDFPMHNFDNRIPNLTFDIKAKDFDQNNITNLIKSVVMIPGSGEFVYDTIVQKEMSGIWRMGKFLELENPTILNNHSSTEFTNSIDSLNDLTSTFKNLEYVSIVGSWFCDDLNAKNSKVYPACESKLSYTFPDEWIVENFNRHNGFEVKRDINGNLRYGGTPTDLSILRYITEIKKRNLKVCFYPMLMVDADGKPWRGRIFADSENDIYSFFYKEFGYRRFILHYANLLKGKIDSFIIGSEMIGLTKFKTNDNRFPAVDLFCELAIDIKNILGEDVKITYAADWSEYHHTKDGYYNLDKLWACNAIDLIGIDAYFPLSNEKLSIYDEDKIKQGWTSGEGYDFYYSNSETKTDQMPLSPEWAWKNIEYFWSNYHYNSDGSKTEWIPKSKKIWFTEYGFPSLDCCTNQPNVFFSSASSESKIPIHSSGYIDFKAQSVAISATEKKWANSEMIEYKFLYCWDARPYPIFPSFITFWSDGKDWKFGHWINGKINSTSLSNIVSNLCKLAGLEDDEFDCSLLDRNIEGYFIDKKSTILSHLRNLSEVYLFDGYLDSGKIIFKHIQDGSIYNIEKNDFLLENDKIQFECEILSDDLIPSSIDFLYLNKEKNYLITSIKLQNDSSNSSTTHSIQANIALERFEAEQIAYSILQNIISRKKYYKIKILNKDKDFKPLDLLTFDYMNEKIQMQISKIKILNTTELAIEGYSVDFLNNKILNTKIKKEINFNNSSYSNKKINQLEFGLIEPYNIENVLQKSSLFFYIFLIKKDNIERKNIDVFISYDEEKNYNFLTTILKFSFTGYLGSFFIKKSPYKIDKINKISIVCNTKNLPIYSITQDQFLNNFQIAMIGDEIIGFKNVEIISENELNISYLSRGLFNTENFIKDHEIGERFILLDQSYLNKIELPISSIGKKIYIKCLSENDNFEEIEAKMINIQGNVLKNFSNNNIKYFYENEKIKIKWNTRKNIQLTKGSNFINKKNQSIFKIYENNTFINHIETNEDFYQINKDKDISIQFEEVIDIS